MKNEIDNVKFVCMVSQISVSYTHLVPDTSALLKNSQLIDELNKEYSKVVIPKVVVDELDNIKNKDVYKRQPFFSDKAYLSLRFSGEQYR